ncbi:MAG: cob(I)yrinic acid a,c-diamide adenosyltransferase [Planctomycetota bacterium]|nr:MAG: cob(I)yrinic acid a,c-diamide adenosyltransferase [Planctomycetota bacterium]
MKIYTKTGDQGETSLLGGARVSKEDIQIEAYGTVDELNSLLGVVLAFLEDPKLCEWLLEIQGHLFVAGTELAKKEGYELPKGKKEKALKITHQMIEELEKRMDEMEESLPPLKSFILPGGGKGGAMLHLARTVCRRAERLVVALSKKRKLPPEILIYFNRLSDFLFVLARYINHQEGKEEVPWNP